MEQPIENRVANSPLITINLEDYYDRSPRAIFDLKLALHEGIILKEKEFRSYLENFDWSVYKDKNVAIDCTTDAIIPQWAHLLVASYLSGIAKYFIAGDAEALETVLFHKALHTFDAEKYKDQKVIIKGCSRYPVPVFAFAEITRLLKPYVSSLMYGEACSTVPVFKRRK